MGLMGAGKSTVGRRVAARLGWPFHDSDRDIEAATGLTVRELSERDGVEAMHDREADQLLDRLSERDPSVIGAAASTIEVAGVRSALERADVAPVWLRADPAVLASRFESKDQHRPEFGDSPLAFLSEQARRRNPLFASVDPIVIDVDRVRPPEVARRVVEALASIRRA
jgi:shikimate kinase